MTHVVVVGAGVAGLSAALHVAKLRAGARVSVLEASARAGGLIETEHDRRGFVIEHGPDSLMVAKPAASRTLSELALDEEVVRTGGARGAFLLDERDRLLALPEGMMSASPSAAWALARSRLLSPRGKLRFFLEPFVPRARPGAPEESVDAFFRRRFGAEMAERVVDPLLRGIYGSPTSELGIESVMPRMLEMERRAGSLARAGLRAPSASGGPPLVTLRGGMGQLADALAGAQGGTLRTGVSVRALARRARGFRLTLGDGGSLDADAVILAVPAWAAARIVEPLDRDLADDLGAIHHAPLASVNLAWRASDVPRPMEGTGFVVSPASRRGLSACTWSSRKWPGRAPEGSALIRVFLRDASLGDEEAIATARTELRDLMGVSAPPLFARIRRHARALPRCGVGHRARVARMGARAASWSGLALAGNAQGGVGVPECIESGARPAALVLEAQA